MASYVQHQTQRLNKFVSSNYYATIKGERVYFCDRLLYLGRINPYIKNAGTNEEAVRDIVGLLQKEYPNLLEACIRDHAQLAFGLKPIATFFRVVNFWNFEKIKEGILQSLDEGITSTEQQHTDMNVPTRQIYITTSPSPVVNGSVVYAAELLKDGVQINKIDSDSCRILSSFIDKFRREWPQRYVAIEKVELNQDNTFVVTYQDGMTVSNSRQYLPGSRIVYTKILHFLQPQQVNLIVFEAIVFQEFQNNFSFAHSAKHLILRHTDTFQEKYTNIIIEYTKQNAIMVTIRSESEAMLGVIIERVLRVRNTYTNISTDLNLMKKWNELFRLIAPSIPEKHSFTMRELKIMTYKIVFGLKNDSRLFQWMRDLSLPNLIVGVDIPFYQHLKNVTFKTMTKFSSRIDTDNNIVCPFSRRPFMVRVPNSVFFECVPPLKEDAVSCKNIFSFTKQTIKTPSPHLRYSVPNSIKPYLPLNTSTGNDYVFVGTHFKDTTSLWQHLLSEYMSNPDAAFCIFRWDAISRKVMLDLQATGKLNARPIGSKLMQFDYIYYLIIIQNSSNGEIARVLRTDKIMPEKLGYLCRQRSQTFLPQLLIDTIKSCVQKREELVNEIKQIEHNSESKVAKIQQRDVAKMIVYINRDGADSALFADAIFLDKAKESLQLTESAHQLYTSKDGLLCASSKPKKILEYKPFLNNVWRFLIETKQEWNVLKYLASIESDSTKVGYMFQALRETSIDIEEYRMKRLKAVFLGSAITIDGGVPYNKPEDIVFTSNLLKFVNLYDFWFKLLSIQNERNEEVFHRARRNYSDQIIQQLEDEQIQKIVERYNIVDVPNKQVHSVIKMIYNDYRSRYNFLTTQRIADMIFDIRARNFKTLVLGGGDASSSQTGNTLRSRNTSNADTCEMKRTIESIRSNILTCVGTTIIMDNDGNLKEQSNYKAAPKRLSAIEDDEDEDELYQENSQVVFYDDEDEMDEQFIIKANKSAFKNKYNIVYESLCNREITTTIYPSQMPIQC